MSEAFAVRVGGGVRTRHTRRRLDRRGRLLAAAVAGVLLLTASPAFFLFDGDGGAVAARPSGFRAELGAITADQAARLGEISAAAEQQGGAGTPAQAAELYRSLRDASAQTQQRFAALEAPEAVAGSTAALAGLFGEQVEVLDRLLADTTGSGAALAAAVEELRLLVERTSEAQTRLEADLVRCGSACA